MKVKRLICFLVLVSLLTGCSIPTSDANENLPDKDNGKKADILIKDGMIGFNNGSLSISVNPKTLEVVSTDKAGEEVKLSDPVGNYNIGEIKNVADGVEFSILNEGVDVFVSLIDDKFNIQFNTDKEKSFTWPKLESTKGFDSYILPHAEGKYIPKNDKTFIEFLTENEIWDTVEFLSMPFIGLYNNNNTYTYIMKSGYNNEIAFNEKNSNLGLSIKHEFTSNHKEKEFSYEIVMSESDYIEPAKVFKNYLIENDEFVTLKEKAEKTEDVKKLFGAVQIYLWSSGVLDVRDIDNWLGFVKDINTNKNTNSIGKLFWNSFSKEDKDLISDYSTKGYVDAYGKKTLIRDINQILKRKDFYQGEYFSNLKASKELQTLIDKGITNLSETEIYRLNLLCFYESYKKYFAVDVQDVGNAFSTKMLKELKKLGIDKAWLGGDNMAQNWELNKYAADKAFAEGYLIGSYDSYHSMHEPGKVKWDTASFPLELWKTGGIMRKDGTYVGGFKQVGRKVSPLAAIPYVKDRMGRIMKDIQVNSWFVDCDAAGEIYEDYNPLHPASKEDDVKARKERLQWMIDKYGLVVGSEGGTWYLSDTIHFAQGMMTPVIAWSDKDMRKNPDSEYYLGKYWPTEGPETFVKQVPLKDKYGYIYFNPKFRLPLYQTVYHDSIITTSHWGSGSLKFSNQINTNALTELLYNVQPLYNLNLEELQKHGDFIKKFYDIFSPMHEITATLPLENFEILSEDRLVQKTNFGGLVEVIANFKDEAIDYENRKIPAQSVEVNLIKEGVRKIYSPLN